LPEHFPASSGLTAANPAEQLAASVLAWLTERIRASSPNPPANLYEELLSRVEPALLEEVMRRVQGNRWTAAQWLGLNRATVRKKLGMYNLTDAYRQKGMTEDDDSEPGA
jgi:Fis family transcriptional regulator